MHLVDSWADTAEGQHFLRLLDGKVADANMPDQALQTCQNLSLVVLLPHDRCLISFVLENAASYKLCGDKNAGDNAQIN